MLLLFWLLSLGWLGGLHTHRFVSVGIGGVGTTPPHHHWVVLSVSAKSLNVMVNNQGYGTDKICGTCLAHIDENGECHRHPPVIIVIGALSEAKRAERPVTELTNWCLDWVRR